MEQKTSRQLEADAARTVLEWADSAPRGARAAMARRLGWWPQRLSAAITDARAGRESARVRQLAHQLRGGYDAAEVLAKHVVPSAWPLRLDRFVADLSERYGAPPGDLMDQLRRSYPTISNMFDEHEYVFARLDEPEGAA